MANKAAACGDEAKQHQIMHTSDPALQKQIGRSLDLDKKRWNETAKWEVQLMGAQAKFRQSTTLAAKLLGTGSKVIGEAAPNDRIFGIGLAPNNPEAQDPSNWRGLNLLGEALMQVRIELRDAVQARSALDGGATGGDGASLTIGQHELCV